MFKQFKIWQICLIVIFVFFSLCFYTIRYDLRAIKNAILQKNIDVTINRQLINYAVANQEIKKSKNNNTSTLTPMQAKMLYNCYKDMSHSFIVPKIFKDPHQKFGEVTIFDYSEDYVVIIFAVGFGGVEYILSKKNGNILRRLNMK